MSDFWDREVVQRQHSAWMALLPVRLHINEMIGEGESRWPIDWFESWLRGRRFRRALSVGCGAGALERDLVRRGLCDSVDAFDGSITSLDIARREAQQSGFTDRLRYFAADFNHCTFPRRAYDIVFFHQSAHHIARLERFFAQVLAALRPDGLVYLDEYIGPSRFDWNEKLLAPQQAFYRALPRSRRTTDALALPIQADDPSEAVRSSEIESRLRIGFEILERRPYGGTLLSLVLPAMSEVAEDALPYFIGCERALLAAGMPSFYAVIVARPRRWKALSLARYAAVRLGRRIIAEWHRLRVLR